MQTLPPFEPAELRPVRVWHKEGRIPMALRHTLNLCKSGEFPAIMNANKYWTTETWIRSFFYKRANRTAKQLAK